MPRKTFEQDSRSNPLRGFRVEVAFNRRYSLVIADRTFGAHAFPRSFDALQAAGSKILDLTATEHEAVGANFFAGLVGAWRAPTGAVPRLAIWLPFERWALLQEVTPPFVQALAEQGTEMLLFYEEQGATALAQWLADGVIRHEVELAIRTLLGSWRPTPDWPIVVEVAAELVRRESPPNQTVRLLACLSGIALGLGDPLIAEPLARDALTRAGSEPSTPLALALRTLGATLIAQGLGREGMQALELAVATAEHADDPMDLAAALCHCATYHYAAGDDVAAEDCFRRAIDISDRCQIGGDMPGIAHHGLACVLLRRGMTEPAALHATKARASRREPNTFAGADSALLLALQGRQDRCN